MDGPRVMQKITLEELREQYSKQHNLHLSQRRLAKLLKLSHSAIHHYETGRRLPHLKNALKIANFFAVPLEMIEWQSRKPTVPEVA